MRPQTVSAYGTRSRRLSPQGGGVGWVWSASGQARAGQMLRTCAVLQFLVNVLRTRSHRTRKRPRRPSFRIRPPMAYAARFGSDRRTFLIESTYADEKPIARPKCHAWRYAVGGEFKVSDNLWLQTDLGTNNASGAGQSGSSIGTNFSYAISKSSSLQ